MALGDSFCCVLQVVLINAVKDVAKALANLISTTKAAAGKPYDDPSMLQLKNSAKVSSQKVEKGRTTKYSFTEIHWVSAAALGAKLQVFDVTGVKRED